MQQKSVTSVLFPGHRHRFPVPTAAPHGAAVFVGIQRTGVTVNFSTRFHNRLDLAAEPSAPRWARLHAQDVLTAWEIGSPAADDALLVVSELVTNAVRHAIAVSLVPDQVAPPTRLCALVLQRMPDHLLISVYDQDRRPPVLKVAAAYGESGRGLHLVDELSCAWGYRYPNTSGGKEVWAKVTTYGGTEPDPAPQGKGAPAVSGPG